MTSSADPTKPEEADSGNEPPRPTVGLVGDRAPGTAPNTIRELLLDAFEAIPEGVAIFDDQDRFVLWNKRYAEMYEELGFSLRAGKPFEELLREGLSRGLYPNAIGREDEWLTNRMERHRRPVNEHEQMLASGKW